MPGSSYSFGPFSFDPATLLLRRGEDLVPVGRRAASILATLLAADGQVVTKNALIEAAWPGLAVEESNLSVQVAGLRRALGAMPSGQSWIVTVERVGYRLSLPGAGRASNLRRSSLPAIAVLPFADFDLPSRHEIGDGVADDVISALARFGSLQVVARSLSFRYDGRAADLRAMATDLGVRYVLEGSVRRSTAGLRINVQLIDAPTGAHLWARLYASEQLSPFDAAAMSIAASVEARIHNAEISRASRIRVADLDAYDFYLRGRARIRSSEERDNAAGFALYSEALALEPENVTFLSAAAEALHHRKAVGWQALTDDDDRLCRQYAARALSQSESDGVAMGLLGNSLMTSGEEDWGLALSRRGAELNPNSPLALICYGLAEMWADNLDQAESTFLLATKLDPSDPTVRFAFETLSRIAIMRNEPELAMERAYRAIAISPAISGAHWSIIAAEDALGHHERARAALERYHRYAPSVTLGSIALGQPFARPDRLAPMLAAARRAGMPER